eukprot:m.175224 g.175224  ORF g.175224 m.175224 type:complete len:58 (+) comp14608_c0_seq6:198-371(+)
MQIGNCNGSVTLSCEHFFKYSSVVKPQPSFSHLYYHFSSICTQPTHSHPPYRRHLDK